MAAATKRASGRQASLGLPALVCVAALLLGSEGSRAGVTTPGSVTIEASQPGKRVYQSDAETGGVSILAGGLDFLIRIAYGVHPRDIVYEVSLDRESLYNVEALPTDGHRNTALSLMREQLEMRFGFEAKPEDRLVPVHILRPLQGAKPLSPSTAKVRNVVGSRSRFSGTRASMGDLARFTRSLTPLPVVDETGFDGVYDLVMEWDPSAGGHAMMQAFEDLGLELVNGKRSVEQLIVRGRPDAP